MNTASPCAVRATASSSSAREADFTRYPVAPAFTASRTSACSPLADSTSTRTRGSAATIWRVASTPSTPGIWRSVSTTWG